MGQKRVAIGEDDMQIDKPKKTCESQGDAVGSTISNLFGSMAVCGRLSTPPRSMKILVWNCCGLGNPWAVQGLKHLLKDQVLDIVFLSETKLKEGEMKTLKNRMQWDNGVFVSCVGEAQRSSGGLVML